MLAATIKRGDPFLVFSAEVAVELPKKPTPSEK